MNYRFGLLSLSLAVGFSYFSVCTSSAAELQLAGIKLGRPALAVIQKYGNPSSMIIGAVGQIQGTTGMPQSAPGMLGMPGAGSPFDITSLGPDMSGLFGPSALSGPTPAPIATSAKPMAVAPEVTWVYNYPKNRQLRFQINPDGIVVQIAAIGVDWPNILTSRRITLGQTYKDIVLKYGYPESHERAPNVNLGSISLPRMEVMYPEKHRVIFTCVGKYITGITIGLMD